MQYNVLFILLIVCNLCIIMSYYVGKINNKLIKVSSLANPIIYSCSYDKRCKLYLSTSVASSSSSSDVVQSPIPSGLLAVYKPVNWTSSDVVCKIKGILIAGGRNAIGGGRIKLKIGHGGTLDPMADGVLVLGIGSGTKLMSSYLSGSKSYAAIAKLGNETDTLDSTGKVTEMTEYKHVTKDMLNENINLFLGNILQVPPMFSALKVDGKKLYELARKGVEIERKAREVTVYNISIADDNQLTLPSFGINLSCSGGFYVRSLISDLARKCNTRAHMTALTRTKQGPFEIEHCVYQKDWTYDYLCNQIIEMRKITESYNITANNNDNNNSNTNSNNADDD